MNEYLIRNNIIKTAKIYEWFGSDGILTIQKEHKLNNKFVDLYIETERSHVLIEIKQKLKSYNIGQLLSYMALKEELKKDNKITIGILLYYSSSKNELKISEKIIKNFIKGNLFLIDFKKN